MLQFEHRPVTGQSEVSLWLRLSSTADPVTSLLLRYVPLTEAAQ